MNHPRFYSALSLAVGASLVTASLPACVIDAPADETDADASAAPSPGLVVSSPVASSPVASTPVASTTASRERRRARPANESADPRPGAAASDAAPSRGRTDDATCVEEARSLVLSLDLSEGRGTIKERLLSDGDEELAGIDGRFGRACDLREGDRLKMEHGAVGLVTGATRRPKPKTQPRDARGRGVERVFATSEHVETRLVHLHTAESDIDATPEHPFFVENRGFVKAGELAAGDPLVTRDDGKIVALLATETKVVPPTSVFNMRVENSPT